MTTMMTGAGINFGEWQRWLFPNQIVCIGFRDAVIAYPQVTMRFFTHAHCELFGIAYPKGILKAIREGISDKEKRTGVSGECLVQGYSGSFQGYETDATFDCLGHIRKSPCHAGYDLTGPPV